MKAFGVGCFHFSIKNEESEKILLSDYVAEVIRTLEKLTAVSNIECNYDKTLADLELDITSPNPTLEEGEGCFPQIPFFELSFSVYIPSRFHSELINLPNEYLQDISENFRVTIVHDWHGPLSYIESLDSSMQLRPSTGVQIVREYLHREISKIESIIFFDWLGPSPLHADFYLKTNNDGVSKEEIFTIEKIHQPGYDKVIFSYPDKAFTSIENALKQLYEHLSQEVAFFIF